MATVPTKHQYQMQFIIIKVKRWVFGILLQVEDSILGSFDKVKNKKKGFCFNSWWLGGACLFMSLA